MSPKPSPTLLDYCKKIHRGKTRQTRLSELRHFNRWFGREATLADLSHDVASKFLASDLPKRKRDDIYWCLRQLWEKAADEGLACPPPADRRGTNRGYPFKNALPPDGERDLMAWFESDYRANRLFGKSEKSATLHRLTIRNFGRHLGRAPCVSDLSDDAIRTFMQHCLDHSKSRHTVNGERHRLCALANFAARKRLIENFPTVQSIPTPEAMPVAWKTEQIQKLMDACNRADGSIGGISANDWWMALHLVFWDTGERTGATLALRWEWLDELTGWLRVPAHVRKGRRKSATYRLRANTLAAVMRLKASGHEEIFYTGFTATNFYLRYGALLKSAGLPSGRRWKPQCMRRSVASYFEAAGGNATDALLHSSRDVTLRSYIDRTIASVTQVSDVLPELCSAGKDGGA